VNYEDGPDLGAYHRWLYRVAASMLPDGFCDPDLDDLVQEGRIAMWKAFEKYEDCKGTLAPWLTNAASMRMKNIAFGHGRYTGHTGRRGWTDATDRNKPRVLSLNLLTELSDDGEFDERRLRPSVAKSVKHRHA
jgi:DNA-directed RNA polymerase specialized sigma24 family protein